MEQHEKKVRCMERISLVSMYNCKTENNCLPKLRYVSSVNKPTSVGIDPVTSFESINIIGEKIRVNKLEAKKEWICFISKHSSKTIKTVAYRI